MTRRLWLVVVHVFLGMSTVPATGQTDFGAVASGNWSSAAIWTPAGGPPGVGQNAFVGGGPAGSAATAVVSLTANQMVQDLHLGQGGGTNGTISFGSFTLTATRELTIGRFGGVGAINHGTGHFVANSFRVGGGNAFLFAPADVTLELSVVGAAVVTTAATGNVTNSVSVIDPGSELRLGGDLSVTTDVDLRGTAATAAVLDAMGRNITARDIFIGRFGNAGNILNDGAITATRDLEVSRGTLALDANDSVADTVAATSNGTLTLHANTAADNAFVGSGGTLNTVATGNLSSFAQVFDAGSTLNLGAHLMLTGDLDLRGTAASPGLLQANGFNIMARDIFIGRFGNAADIMNDSAITATRDLEVSRGTFALDANDSVADTVAATSNGTLTLHPNTAADNAFVGSGGTLNTVATGNLSSFAQVFDAGSTLNLGAHLMLTGDLDLRGTAASPGLLQANGFNIMARDIFIGRFGNAADIMNDSAITATRDLEVSRGTFALDANDSVADTVAATSNGTLTLHANTAADNAFVGSGGTLNTVATGNLSSFAQVFDAGSTLNLGAHLMLTGDLDLRGTAASPGLLQANGFNIMARDIFIGRFGNAADIMNDSAITATRDLEVSRGTFALDANDSVADTVAATSNGTLTLHANTAADNAFVGSGGTLNTVATGNLSSFAQVFDAGSTLNLGAHLMLTGDLDLRGTAASPGLLQANGFNIMARDIFIGRFGNAADIMNDSAITATRDLEVSRGTFALDANDSVADTVAATSNGTLTLHANTAADNAFVGSGGTLNTVATGNLSSFAQVFDAGSTLNLGADVILSEDIDIRGTGPTVATVAAHGFDVTARDVFVGRFNNTGALTDVELLTAGRTLSVERSQLLLNGGFDSVGSSLRVVSDSRLMVTQDADSVRGLSLEGNTLDILDTSVLELNFDAVLSSVGDWVFRWANPTSGDRVAAMNGLISSGRIVVNSSHSFVVVDNGDGYTYIANFASDFNNDDKLNCQDIDLLTAAIVAGSTDLMFDLNGDGTINTADRDQWLADAGSVFLRSGNPFLPGDANLDGVVDGSDFGIWNANKFTVNSAWCSGDFNTDGRVDGSDFGIWNANKFRSSDGIASVPEPVCGSWLLCFLGMAIRGRRRRRKEN